MGNVCPSPFVSPYLRVRDAVPVAPDDDSITRFEPYVAISPSDRDRLCTLVEAAAAFVATTSYFRQTKASRPEFERLALALIDVRRGE